MRLRRLGRSPIYVSDICMGTMTFGSQCAEGDAFRIMDMACDAGVDFVDTAEMYPVPPDDRYVGATSPAQMPDILAAAELSLDPDTLARIDEVSREIRYPMG